MRSDPRELDDRTFDLLVIGAGIQGAAIARDAAVRGLAVLLVDARDIAAGTSSRSSRLVHGGLRYLRHGHFALVREALGERERLLRGCPHLVRPVPMLMPFFRGSGGSPLLLRAATWLYQWLAGRSTLPGPRSLAARECLAAFPGLRSNGLRSGVVFFDAATQDTRLTLANVLAAHAAGAKVATWCEVVGVKVGAVQLYDRIGGHDVLVHARHVVNAAGPRVDAVRRAFSVAGEPLVRQSRGSHLVLPPRASDLALAAFLPDRRIQFVVPHTDGTLCGTTEVENELPGDETAPPGEDVDYLLAALAHLLEPAPQRHDVRFAYAGWRALPRRPGPAGGLNREGFVVAEVVAAGTLHTVVGGKLTTHRSFAERVVRGIFGLHDPSPTRWQALPGGDGPREVGEPLWWRHGSRVQLVRQLIVDEPALAAPLCPHRPFLAAELVHALRHDGAVAFADAIVRRLVHSQGPCVQPECLRAAHQLFLRERRAPVDDEADAAIVAVQQHVLETCGALWDAPAAP